jgi:hypothetical protein
LRKVTTNPGIQEAPLYPSNYFGPTPFLLKVLMDPESTFIHQVMNFIWYFFKSKIKISLVIHSPAFITYVNPDIETKSSWYT